MTDAARYRDHAASTRKLAHEAKTPALRAAFLPVAAEWDDMADHAELYEAQPRGARHNPGTAR